MDKELFDILTDRFINNELSPEERINFCREMEHDKELREFVVLRKLLIEGELMLAEQKARQAMEQSASSVKKLRRYEWVAAACILILVIGITTFGYSYKYDTSYIYNTYSSIPAIERSRGEGGLKGEIADINEKVITFYDEGKPESVVMVFQNTAPDIIKQLPVHTLLYIAISLIETNRSQEAMDILSGLHDSEYREDVTWLELVASLQMGARENAISIAGKVIEENGNYASKALQILVALKEKKWF